MNRNAKVKKRTVSFLMAVILIVTMMPFSLLEASAENKDKTAENNTAVSVKWETDKDDKESKDKNTVSLKASLNKQQEDVTSAEVKIKLKKEDLKFLNSFKDEKGNFEQTLQAEDKDDDIPVLLEISESGEAFIKFIIDKENAELKKDILFSVPEDISPEKGTHEIKITEEDITVDTYKGEDTADAIIEKEGGSFTLEWDIKFGGEDKENKNKEKNDAVLSKASPKGIEPEITILEREKNNIDHVIYWSDNNDEESIRPGTDKYKTDYPASLKFTVKDGDSIVTSGVLDEENMEKLGMDSVPKPDVRTEDGKRQYTYRVNANTLPTKIRETYNYGPDDKETKEYDVSWEIQPSEVDGYHLVNVTEENKEDYNSVGDNLGWYYMLDTSFEVKIAIRWGNRIGSDADLRAAIDAALNSHMAEKFYFEINYGDNYKSYSLRQLIDWGLLEDNRDEIVLTNISETATLTVKNLWKYNLDNSRMSYDMVEGNNNIKPTGKLDIGDDGTALQKYKDDYFTISYDNSQAPNVGDVTDKVYNGGSIWLTLTGEKDYEAEKVWLDDTKTHDRDDRPDGEFQLWRYRDGESYSTAAAVRDDEGNIITVKLDKNKDQQDISFDGLEKYDKEGCEYIYVLREYLEGSNASAYEQIFGSVKRDKDTGDITVTDTIYNGETGKYDNPKSFNGKRTDDNANDDFLYNGGTLSNKIKGNVKVEAVKTWKAAAFQTQFEDVDVELTLQSREKGSNDKWIEAKDEEGKVIKKKIDDFQLEYLTRSLSLEVPEHDMVGQELEYRWIETGVYQADGDNLIKQVSADGSKQVFELQQIAEGKEKTVKYESVSEFDEETGNSVITNSIANEVDYNIVKKWYDSHGDETNAPKDAKVKFTLYRSAGSSGLGDEIGEVTLDGTEDKEKVLVNKELGIYAKETTPWNLTIYDLDEYDSEGRQYSYFIYENDMYKGYVAEYDVTKDDDGNYFATVINAPGEENWIFVQKYWIDDSNVMDRKPVTIGVYEKGTNKRIGEATLQNGIWNDFVGIGKLDPDDVYIIEEEIGNKDTGVVDVKSKHPEEALKNGPTLYNGKNYDKCTKVAYQTEPKESGYKYEATYGEETIDGQTVYTVSNRRIGDIDLTVTKQWLDGDGEKREDLKKAAEKSDLTLAMKLIFDDGMPKSDEETISVPDDYKITYNDVNTGDTVDVGNPGGPVDIKDNSGKNNASAIQSIRFDEKTSLYYFHQLPKYDKEGKVVNYRAEEVWLDKNGKEVSRKDLKEDYEEVYDIWKEYSSSTGEETYTVGDYHTDDQQKYTIKNKLSYTKNILWHKSWRDEHAYESGTRPDIYLDIYQVKHKEDGGTETSVYQKKYKWEYNEDFDDTGIDNPEDYSDKTKHWHATLSGLPKYDNYGYEIKYYAVENTEIQISDFDYMPAQYYHTNDNGTIDQDGYIGSEEDITEENVQKYGSYVIDIGNVTRQKGEVKYALSEGGTFVNYLYSDITIQGQKIWSSLPSGYKSINLPVVTFELYQKNTSENDDPDSIGDPVSTITISDWADILNKGSYLFKILYKGENTVKVERDGSGNIKDITASGPAGVPEDEWEPLPTYNDRGQKYHYTLVEKSIKWDEDVETNADPSDVFKGFTGADILDGYIADNNYDSIKGALAIKKYLELPMKDDDTPEAYPAVTFELTRTYVDNNGDETSSEVVERKTWSSEEVKKAYEDQSKGIINKIKASISRQDLDDIGTEQDPLEKLITFENLDIYAPNGSEYKYSVREVKDNLGGYTTWAIEGDRTSVEVKQNGTETDIISPADGLQITENKNDGRGETEKDVAVTATFANAQDKDRETVILQGNKNWRDYSNIFHERPENIDDYITVYRGADSQPGQSNSIAYTQISKDIYDITWEKGDWSTSDKWVYKVEGNKVNELEKYAPNGMPWKYRIKETLPDGSVYTRSPAEVNQKKADVDEITMNDLTNSIQVSIPYTKKWVDEDGKELTNDYLDADVTVGFELQAVELNENGSPKGDWESASKYFKDNLTEEAYNKVFQNGNYKFTAEKTGRISDTSVWKTAYFSNLPSFIKDKNSAEKKMGYRVAETGITYNGKTQTVNVTEVKDHENTRYEYKFSDGIFSTYTPGGKGYYSSYDGKTTDRNIYNKLETTDLKVSKLWKDDAENIYGTRTDTDRENQDWQVSFIIQKSTDNGHTWENVKVHKQDIKQDLTVTLYGQNSDDSSEATISGLPVTDENGKTYEYAAKELKHDYEPDDGIDNSEIITGEPDNNIYNNAYEVSYDSAVSATNQMKYVKVYAEKDWNISAVKKSVTLELKYKGTDGKWKSFRNPAKVTLDGQKDKNVSNTSIMASRGAALYDTTDLPYYEYGEWKAVWENIPEVMPGSLLNADGKTEYKVVETVPGGYILEKEAQSTIKIPNDGEYFLFTFENNEKTSLEVTKAWYGIASEDWEDIAVGLWRTTGKIGDENSEKVMTDNTGVQKTITLTKAGKWKGTFSNLPKYSQKGELYTYYARELTIGGEPVEDFNYYIVNTDQNGNNDTYSTKIANIGRMDISGTKTWKDNSNKYETRPDDIELTLYRSIKDGEEEVVDIHTLTKEGAVLSWTDKASDQWKYEYKGLLKTDDEGNQYSYRVEEKSAESKIEGDQYKVSQNQYDLINTLTGTVEIPVTKIWKDRDDKYHYRPDSVTVAVYGNDKEVARKEISGDGDEWSYTFENLDEYDKDGKRIEYRIEELDVPDDYDVSVSGDKDDGFIVENKRHGRLSVSKTVKGNAGDTEKPFHFTIELDENITGLYGEIEFTEGKAEVTLKDGESKTASGLPADIEYTVTEKEANTDGYSTTSEGASGVIQAGDEMNADFINSKDTTITKDTKTGDDMNFGGPTILMTMSLIGITAALLMRRKRRN